MMGIISKWGQAPAQLSRNYVDFEALGPEPVPILR
jgi:hypothetical protein